jgi:hypothetical protein
MGSKLLITKMITFLVIPFFIRFKYFEIFRILGWASDEKQKLEAVRLLG